MAGEIADVLVGASSGVVGMTFSSAGDPRIAGDPGKSLVSTSSGNFVAALDGYGLADAGNALFGDAGIEAGFAAGPVAEKTAGELGKVPSKLWSDGLIARPSPSTLPRIGEESC
ncbi:MAG TPA: hypothetical protein VGM18_13825 [Candidatus Sulfotelmatobacter sp.]|jgi:hypothetical protein